MTKSTAIAELKGKGKRIRSKERKESSKNGRGAAESNGTEDGRMDRYDRDGFGSWGLTRRQALFVLEYITDPSSQAAAAERAGYSPTSAHTAASKLMNRGNVREAIEHLQSVLRENTEISASMVLERLGQIAFDTAPKPRAADQVKALELMSRWLGLDIANSNMQLELVVRYEDPHELQQLNKDTLIEDAVLIEDD